MVEQKLTTSSIRIEVISPSHRIHFYHSQRNRPRIFSPRRNTNLMQRLHDLIYPEESYGKCWIVKRRGCTQSSFHINEFLFRKFMVKKRAPLLQAKMVCQNRVMEMYRARMYDNVIDSLEDNLVIRHKKSHL